MRVVALKPHRYGGVGYKTGEAYEARDKDAEILILGKVVTQEEAPKSKRATAAKALKPEHEEGADKPTATEPELVKPKRSYRRRDLEAEGRAGADVTEF